MFKTSSPRPIKKRGAILSRHIDVFISTKYSGKNVVYYLTWLSVSSPLNELRVKLKSTFQIRKQLLQ